MFDGNFIPLLTNKNGEIVGYATIVNKGWFFVLPQIKDKPNFLDGMFEVLAEIFPALFPEHGRFAWLDDGSYPLPGEEDLNQDRVRIEKQYASDISANEAGVARLKDEYQFLRTMLTATGDDLVRAVCHFLNWLEFSGVTSMDDHVTDLFEEDIQVELGSGLLVVEVKGIGGTSKDKECAQISKIKHRRQEERQAFDVYALYVVNHQRHMPPRSRANPPFTAHQMNDAQLDKRGLVTTWQLYNVYFDVEGGLLDKSDVRQSLLMYGVVEFSPPSLSEIGTVSEVFKKGRVIILQLSDKSLKKGMELFSVKGGVYSRITVLGLQVDGQDVDQAEACEVGISIDTEVKRGAKIFMSV
ncbi:hypothetical protein JN403_12290 [Pseudomonas sp. 15A4]|uniref:hypothetical protein n=1 Tax=Pseudomonas sp. 15A4 TaxID=2804761 RepID=UPI001966E810|nr:hypothetical protein [Pseudomonas sp. 15A4]QSB21526.1 hypothetical protein JN403_12290 [Pseudomonas sp. 15A4]